jgi:hypothetical protein
MERTLLGSAVSTLSGSLASAWNGLRGKARPGPIPEPTVASRANNVYSFLDIYGNGNDVCQLYNGTSNPTSRDFTADELTDGTYLSWYNSGTTLVTVMYDQKGSFDFSDNSFSAPQYDDANNDMYFRKFNPYARSKVRSQTSDQSAINSTFGGNTNGQGTTIVSTLRNMTTVGVISNTPIFIIRDDNPTYSLNDRHKGLITVLNSGYIGSSIKDDSYTPLNVISDDAIDSTLRMFTATQEKTDATTTTIKAYKGDSEVASTSATTISESIELVQMEWGYTDLRTQTAMLFTEALSGGDVATLKVELESL